MCSAAAIPDRIALSKRSPPHQSPQPTKGGNVSALKQLSAKGIVGKA